MVPRLLEGQVALVTGAGRGLGRAFAERLARLGCHLGVHGMREHGPAEYGEGTTLSDTARAIGEAHAVRTCRVLGDLTRIEHARHVVATVEAEVGPIDILVHNAGGDIAAAGGKPDPNDAVLVKEEDVRSVLDRNLLSTILVCQEVARGMMQRRRGRILTISSIAAFRGRSHSAIYATAKAGMVQYTRCLADQLRPYDIRVKTRSPRARPGRHASSARATWRPSGCRKKAPSTASPRWMKWHVWWSSSPAPQAPSSRDRCCASTAERNAGPREAAARPLCRA
jgi:3-oxoacyl-[acyl-carrier protein] reductase